MKLTAVSLIALAAFAPAAFASGLTAAQEFEIRSLVPGVDLSNLTDAQAAALADAIHHSDGSDAARLVRSILK